MNTVFDPEFWEHAWDERVKEFSLTKDESEPQQARRWNSTAATFAANNLRQDSARRTQTLDFLKSHISFEPGMSVLDIGSGPGTFAIPLAEMGMQVTALDPAEQMLFHLLENLPSPIKGSVEPVVGIWQTINPESKGWYDHFDLVFASLTPGINAPAYLKEMINCSRKWCYLSTFAGPRSSPLIEELYRLLFNEPVANRRHDIIFPFNYLYSLGYFPHLNFTHVDTIREQSIDEVYADFLTYLTRSTQQEITQELESKLRSILEERAVNGLLLHGWKYAVGMLLWDITKKRTV